MSIVFPRREAEAHAFLDANPDITSIHVIWTDICGVARGKILRRLPARCDRIVISVRREYGSEAGDVLLVQLGDRLVDPVGAERDAGTAVAHVVARPAGVDRLLEQSDASFGPQPLAEEHR